MLWERGHATSIGSLGGTQFGEAAAINDHGKVVGFSSLPGNTTFDAFFWSKSTGMRDLGTLPGSVSSFAAGINNAGLIVGGSNDPNGLARAFIVHDGTMSDLNTLLPASSTLSLIYAFDINSRGEIVGLALDTTTQQFHAYLARPSDRDAAAAKGKASPRAKVVLSEDLRMLLQQRLGSRYRIPGLGAPKD